MFAASFSTTGSQRLCPNRFSISPQSHNQQVCLEWLGLFRFPSGASWVFQHLVPKVEQCTAQNTITRLGSFSVVPM